MYITLYKVRKQGMANTVTFYKQGSPKPDIGSITFCKDNLITIGLGEGEYKSYQCVPTATTEYEFDLSEFCTFNANTINIGGKIYFPAPIISLDLRYGYYAWDLYTADYHSATADDYDIRCNGLGYDFSKNMWYAQLSVYCTVMEGSVSTDVSNVTIPVTYIA